jgi:hypothetical protein
MSVGGDDRIPQPLRGLEEFMKFMITHEIHIEHEIYVEYTRKAGMFGSLRYISRGGGVV